LEPLLSETRLEEQVLKVQSHTSKKDLCELKVEENFEVTVLVLKWSSVLVEFSIFTMQRKRLCWIHSQFKNKDFQLTVVISK